MVGGNVPIRRVADSAHRTEPQLSLDLDLITNASPHRQFRSELTIERNPLFVVNGFKGTFFERSSPTLDPATGEVVFSRLIVGKMHPRDEGHGVLRQAHQAALYRLLQLWDRAGYPLIRDVRPDGGVREMGVVHTTPYELVTMICPGDDSADAYTRARRLLSELRQTPIYLENVQTWAGWLPDVSFYLLGEMDWRTRRVDRKTGRPDSRTTSSVVIQFSEFITSAFQSGYFRVLLGQQYDATSSSQGRKRGELAPLLYAHLDEKLDHDAEYRVSLRELSERFGATRYEQKSRQRSQFAAALRTLQGTLLHQSSCKLQLELEETRTEMFLVARRVPTVLL